MSTATTIREETDQALIEAMDAGRICATELEAVRAFWRENDRYAAMPYGKVHDGYFERENEVAGILRKAFA